MINSLMTKRDSELKELESEILGSSGPSKYE
jgi:hypothetical protein